jgi:hypothetical protein
MEYKNVTIKHKANIYDGGKVVSRTIVTDKGEMKTLGVMQPGVYRFNTQAPEVIDVLQGRCRVKLAGAQNWDEYGEGESISIPGNSHFEIDVSELLDYICHFG